MSGVIGGLNAWLSNANRVARRQLSDLWNRPDDFGHMQSARWDEDFSKQMASPESALDFAMPLGGLAGVIKAKGGNWLRRPGDAFDVITTGASKGASPEAVAALEDIIVDGMRGKHPELDYSALGRLLDEARINSSIGEWFSGPFQKYVKNQLATPEDPVRALAEKGITHSRELRELAAQNSLRFTPYDLAEARVKAGFPEEGLGLSDLAKLWEARADDMISTTHAAALQTYRPDMPDWVAKLAPDDEIYRLNENAAHAGFSGLDDLSDAFRTGMTDKTLPPNLQLTPERLKGMGMEKAVVYSDNMQRFKELQEEMALRESANKMPVLKEYPDGYKWIDITRPQDVPLNQADKMVEDLLNYEGKKMKHCVGGYCEDVLDGKTRIMSLRGPDGKPHITVEGVPTPEGLRIEQVKGGSNLPPKEEYLPYARDFFKSEVPGPYKINEDDVWNGIQDYTNLGFVDPRTLRNLQGRLSSKNMEFDYGDKFGPAPKFELDPTAPYTRDELAELITRQKPEGVDPNFWDGFYRSIMDGI